VLQQIKKMLFTNEFKPILCPEHEDLLQFGFYPSPARIPMACIKVENDPQDPEDLEGLRHLTFKESAIIREVRDTPSGNSSGSYTHPMKLWKMNIGSQENPKLASIGDYWDKQTMIEIQTLLWEYEDLFPRSFLEIKGVKGGLGEMKIELKAYAKPFKHRLYRLNPRVKYKVKKEIDRMLATDLIFPVDEVKWISLIVIQNKKGTKDIRVCVYYRSLNSTCMHDHLLTSFSDEALDQVAGNEAYSFTDGFFRLSSSQNCGRR